MYRPLPLSLCLCLCCRHSHPECCCKNDKTPFPNTLDASNITPITGSSAHSNFNGNQAESSLPPNYDEIDPPPSYATLFPGNKTTESPSTTNTTTTTTTTPITVEPTTQQRPSETVINTCIGPLPPASLSVIVHNDGTVIGTPQPNAPILASSSSATQS